MYCVIFIIIFVCHCCELRQPTCVDHGVDLVYNFKSAVPLTDRKRTVDSCKSKKKHSKSNVIK